MWIVIPWHKKPANNHLQALFLLPNLSLICNNNDYRIAGNLRGKILMNYIRIIHDKFYLILTFIKMVLCIRMLSTPKMTRIKAKDWLNLLCLHYEL